MDTLVLNNDGTPLNGVLQLSTVNWQDAIRNVWLDKVTVLEWYDDWVITSPTWETKVPAVMILKDYIRKNNKPTFTKHNVLLRDRFECQFCEVELTRSTATMDHVLPRARGGKTEWTNIVAACNPCNHRKGHKIIKPIRKPYEPSYYELMKVYRGLPCTESIKHPSWTTYM